MSFSHIAKTINIFFSYAHEDESLFAALRKHLATLKQQGHIEMFFDSAISAGSELQQIMDGYISDADIIVLLISSDFLDSKICIEVEMKRALELWETGAARVLAVLLRPLDWKAVFPANWSGLLPTDGMAVSVWQNMDAAFVDVTKGIRKVVEELAEQFTTMRNRNAKFPLWYVPHRRNRFFTGRQNLLNELYSYFNSRQAVYTHVQALNGMGGIGKTQLALEYAYRHEQEYQAVFWLQASSRELLSAESSIIAERLALPERDRTDEAHLFAAIKRWLQRNNQWLLVLDNLEDFTLFDLLVPPQCNGHVLLTTRIQAIGALAQPVSVAPMTIDEGALFLLRRARIIMEYTAPETASLKDYTSAQSIVQEVDGHPLALDQAGAYIEETRRSLTTYLALYRKNRARLLKRRGNFSDGHEESVTTTFTMAFDRVARSDPTANDLLYLLAFLHPDAIPDEMIVQGASELNEPLRTLAADPIALDTTLASLLSFSLIQRKADTTLLSIHRVIQDVLKDLLDPDLQREWASRAVRLVNEAFPDGGFSSWPISERYLPQAQACAQLILDLDLTFKEAAQLLDNLGKYCYDHAQYNEAERYFVRAVTIREQVLGVDHVDTAHTLNALGLLLQAEGHYHEAEALHQRALSIYEHNLGQDDPATASILNNLALLYQAQGKDMQAEPLLQRALVIHERAYGTEHPETAPNINNLALFYRSQGNYQQAEVLYRRALAIYERAFGATHPDVALALNNLGRLYRLQGDHLQAKALYQRALTIYEQVFGATHPGVALALNNLGRLYRLQGNYSQAEPLLQRAVAISKQIFGAEHATTALYLSNLAELYTDQGRYEQAEQFFIHSLRVYEQTLGSEHINRVIAMEKYARLLELMQKTEEAHILQQVALDIKEKHTYKLP